MHFIAFHIWDIAGFFSSTFCCFFFSSSGKLKHKETILFSYQSIVAVVDDTNRMHEYCFVCIVLVRFEKVVHLVNNFVILLHFCMLMVKVIGQVFDK